MLFQSYKTFFFYFNFYINIQHLGKYWLFLTKIKIEAGYFTVKKSETFVGNLITIHGKTFFPQIQNLNESYKKMLFRISADIPF